MIFDFIDRRMGSFQMAVEKYFYNKIKNK